MSVGYNRLRPIVAAFILLLPCLSAAATEDDGPYVMRNATGALEAWSVHAAADAHRQQILPLAPNATITIASVGTIPSFDVKLRGPAEVDPDEVSITPKASYFVVADTHGEFEILAQMLMQHHVLDRNLHWSFGRGHLVILGDVFDRGAYQTEILWLIYALEAEARKAGGAVHLVLGNHEVMILRGDLRYLNAKYRATAQALGVSSYSELFGADSVLGQWLRSKPAMLKINRMLFLHGGVSPELIARRFTLSQVNSTIRALLLNREFTSRLDLERADFLSGQAGPLWYRGYFAGEGGPAEATVEDIQRIREFFSVSTILVGHTRVPTITPLYAGQVIAVQVYPQRDANGVTSFEALLVREGQFYRARPDGKIERL
ncbi:MAG: metallophosphoesterase [Povalibacter sp.]